MFRRHKRDRPDRSNGASGEGAAPAFAEARERMVAHVAREVRDKRVLDAMRRGAAPRSSCPPRCAATPTRTAHSRLAAGRPSRSR